MNEQAQQQQQLSWEDMVINGVPARDLSESGQRLFKKILTMKQESDELQALFAQKQSAMKELSDMLLEEVKELKEDEEEGEEAQAETTEAPAEEAETPAE